MHLTSINEKIKIIEKYNIDYLLYDKSLIPIVGSTKAIQYDRLDLILRDSKNITQIKNFGQLSIYKISHQQKINSFINISSSPPNIGPGIPVTNGDVAYLNHGEYMTTSKKPFDFYYPFLDLTTQSNTSRKTWNIFELPSEWLFTGFLPFNSNSYSYTLLNEVKFNLYIKGNPTEFILPISSNMENKSLNIHFPKLKISNIDLTQGVLKNCSNLGFIDKKIQGTSIQVASNNGATGCITYPGQDLIQKYGYLVKITNQNLKGQKLFFYILDDTREQNYLEDRLKKNMETYIIAPRFDQGIGYSFNFNNNSYENIESVNRLNSLDIYLLPYTDIKNISLQKTNLTKEKPTLEVKYNVKKINYYSYLVSGESLSDNTLILYQSFDPGWKTYEMANGKWQMANWIKDLFPFFFGKELKEHVLVNNWANGWLMPSSKFKVQSSKLVIVFWPQYLEYLGLGILIGTFAWLFWSFRTDSRYTN